MPLEILRTIDFLTKSNGKDSTHAQTQTQSVQRQTEFSNHIRTELL